MNWFSRFFCKHNYIVYDEIPCTFKFEDGYVSRVPIQLLVCSKCGKRIVLRDKELFYNKSVLRLVELWRKGLFNWEKLGEDDLDVSDAV